MKKYLFLVLALSSLSMASTYRQPSECPIRLDSVSRSECIFSTERGVPYKVDSLTDTQVIAKSTSTISKVLVFNTVVSWVLVISLFVLD